MTRKIKVCRSVAVVLAHGVNVDGMCIFSYLVQRLELLPGLDFRHLFRLGLGNDLLDDRLRCEVGLARLFLDHLWHRRLDLRLWLWLRLWFFSLDVSYTVRTECEKRVSVSVMAKVSLVL